MYIYIYIKSFIKLDLNLIKLIVININLRYF